MLYLCSYKSGPKADTDIVSQQETRIQFVSNGHSVLLYSFNWIREFIKFQSDTAKYPFFSCGIMIDYFILYLLEPKVHIFQSSKWDWKSLKNVASVSLQKKPNLCFKLYRKALHFGSFAHSLATESLLPFTDWP